MVEAADHPQQHQQITATAFFAKLCKTDGAFRGEERQNGWGNSSTILLSLMRTGEPA